MLPCDSNRDGHGHGHATATATAGVMAAMAFDSRPPALLMAC
jgi:hypothetical protein